MNTHAESAGGNFPTNDRRLFMNGLVIVSVLPLLVKAVDYALIGSYLPLAVLAVFGLLLGWSLMSPWTRAKSAGVKVWAVALVLWALARLGLLVLHLVLEIPEAHIAAQFTPWYLTISVVHAVIGVWLYRLVKARRVSG